MSQSLLLFCYQRIVEVSFVCQNKRNNVFTKPLGNESYRIVCSIYIQLLCNQGAGFYAQTSLELQYNMQILRASKVMGEVIAGGYFLRGTSTM